MDYYSSGGGGGGGGTGWGATQVGNYWVGQDGNVWVAGNDGVNSAGQYDTNSDAYWSQLGYTRIDDPNASGATLGVNTSGTGTSGDSSLLQQGFNTGIANLQGQYDTLGNQEQLAVKNINDQYGTTSGRLQQAYNTGNNNLQVATNNVNASKTRSLANLGDWLRGMGQGYSNQLGAMGAGDSSATGLINFALGKQGSRERGNILQDAGAQLNNLNMQGDQLRVDFENNMYDLDKWKTDNLNQITIDYASARDQIANSILDARARYAAEQELTQQAIDYLKQLEQQYTNQASSMNDYYSKLAAGQNINPQNTQFSYSPVAQAQFNPLTMPNQVNPESGITAYLKKRDQNLYSNPLGA